MENFISLIVPCRNEEEFISKCLDSIIANDFPKDKLEILVVDGMSRDKTREIIKKYSQAYSYLKLLNNPKKYTPFALNIGVKNSKGDIIMRMDVHAGYEKDYISKCLKYLKEYNADNVGGVIKTIPADKTLTAKAIAICLSSFFGTGGSKFRTGSKEVIETDTVFGGCFKKEVFDKVGLFNENLIRTQDLEFNLRLKRAGGKIILAPDITSFYYPKSNLKDFFLHNLEDGIWSIYPLKFVKMPLGLRHYLPLAFMIILIISWFLGIFSYFFYQLFSLIIIFYILASLFFSTEISIREKEISFLYLMPIVFASRHFGYGFGSLYGAIKLLKENGIEKTKRN